MREPQQMKNDHKISHYRTAVTEDFNLFDNVRKKKVAVNTDNIKMNHFYTFLLFQLYFSRDSVLISTSKKAVYTEL